MIAGLTVNDGRVAPCFAGVELWIVDSEGTAGAPQIFKTDDWPALTWGRELSSRNINILICSGIDRFLWGALQGVGIDVIPNVMGSCAEVIDLWKQGTLTMPQMWPAYGPAVGMGRGMGRGMRRGRRRMRGGKRNARW